MTDHAIRMFSFVGDTVLDPFTGTASTQVPAAGDLPGALALDLGCAGGPRR
ncbi:MAG: hypothetical protein OXI46_03105 [Gemmatimonadota bacterium]|nr:hypothetical protein [Gemmatimonadota bacterium]